MVASVDFTISFDSPDEEGWIVARILEVPGAMSQGRSREEARENVLDALRTVLTPDEELAGEAPAAEYQLTPTRARQNRYWRPQNTYFSVVVPISSIRLNRRCDTYPARRKAISSALSDRLFP